MKKQKSIAQINKEIAREQAKVNREMDAEKKRKNLAVAKKRLFEMKHRKSIGVFKIIKKGGNRVYKIAQESEKRQARSSSASKKRRKSTSNSGFGGLPDYSSFAGY
jgi:hypothetical protein